MNLTVWTAWLAVATSVLAVGGIAAAVFAYRTWRAEVQQLDLAREEVHDRRRPVLQGVVVQTRTGSDMFLLLVTLRSSELITQLHVAIPEPAKVPFTFWNDGSTSTSQDWIGTPAGLWPGQTAKFEMTSGGMFLLISPEPWQFAADCVTPSGSYRDVLFLADPPPRDDKGIWQRKYES
jgi:hypothetical protein